MTTEYFAGETIRISADDLTLRTGGEVTSGATVEVAIADTGNTTVSTTTVTSPGDGNDWWADIAAPTTPGFYFVEIAATKNGAVWKGRQRITVKAF